MAIGGAASNALDQVLRGVVVDFIDLGFWPVFNLADLAIVAGIVTGTWGFS
jgi:signal peptidase II